MHREGLNSCLTESGQPMRAIRKPRICCIHLLDNCFMRCRMCMYWKEKYLPPLITLRQWEKFLLSLKNFVDEPITISLVGGEPLIYKDIFALVKIIDTLGLTSHITSNGFLINKPIAEKIVESNLESLGLSLESLDGNTHDYLRGRKGSFEKIMGAIRYLKDIEGNLDITVMTIIMGKNIEHIIPLVRWVQSNNDIKFISFQVIMPPFMETVDEDWYYLDKYKELWPQDIDKACGILDLLIKMKKEGFFKIGNPLYQLENYKKYFLNPGAFIKKDRKCHYTDSQLWINPRGQIYLCPNMNPIGDIKSDIKEAYYSQEAQETRKQITLCKRNCHLLVNCNYED